MTPNPPTEPRPSGLRLTHDHGRALSVSYADQPLLRYVYEPWDQQMESPKPYFHPLHTLGGDLVSLYRPHDHLWHKGIAWSLPNVGPANFWGGPTYRRDEGYVRLPNNGSTKHQGFEQIETTDDRLDVVERLAWVTEQGETWFDERRRFAVSVDRDGGTWTLLFETRFTNTSGQQIDFGSPTTEGRENAGYGGLFWRGPRSFSGGKVYTPGTTGRDELMGTRAPWMGYAGRHDEHGRWSSLVFVDGADNPGVPTQWFVRTDVYACLCPAPFFGAEVPVADGETLTFRYAVVIADGDCGVDGAEQLAAAGSATLAEAQPSTG